MNNPETKKLFDYLRKSNLYDSDNYEDFELNMQIEDNRKQLFDYMVSAKMFEGDFDQFNTGLGYKLKKKEGTELSGETPSMVSKSEDERYSNVKDVTDEALTPVKFVKGAAKGFYNRFVETASGLSRAVASILPDKFYGPEGTDVSADARLKYFDENLSSIFEEAKYEDPGKSNLLTPEGNLSNIEAESFGMQIGDGLAQIIQNISSKGNVAMGVQSALTSILGNAETYYKESAGKDISEKKRYRDSVLFGVTEFAMDRSLGVESMVAKGASKAGVNLVKKQALEQITKKVVEQKAFNSVIKNVGKFAGLKNLAKRAEYIGKGYLTEAGDEFLQNYAVGAEKEFLDAIESGIKYFSPESKLEVYNEDLTSAETFYNSINSGFIGGFTGAIGSTFTTGNGFNSTVYGSLYNEYESNGTKGLNKAVDNIGRGIDKAYENGKLTEEEYDNASTNLARMSENVRSFDQQSDIPLYNRFLSYNILNNNIPTSFESIASIMADSLVSTKTANQNQIKNDIASGKVQEVVYSDAFRMPEAFQSYIVETNTQEGQIKAVVPQSIIDAEAQNAQELSRAKNMVLSELQARFDKPNQKIKLDDIKKFAESTSFGFVSDATKLQFDKKFKDNRGVIQKFIRHINLGKNLYNKIVEENTAPDPLTHQKMIAAAMTYEKGDKVEYDGQVGTITNVSEDGQLISVDNQKEQIQAIDEKLNIYEGKVAERGPKTIAKKQEDIIEDEEGYTIGDAINDNNPIRWNGRAGIITQMANGTVLFKSDEGIDYELGNIDDVEKNTLQDWNMSYSAIKIEDDNSVLIDGKRFNNREQNPFTAISYDEKTGDAKSVTLYTEDGKKRTIRGARATAIDLQYKWKQVLNKLTDEQLQQANNEAKSREQSIRDIGDTTVEPAEGAPRKILSKAEIERARAVKQIVKEFGDEARKRIDNAKKAVNNLTNSLMKSGIRVEVLSAAEIKNKYNLDVNQGVFISEDSAILINRDVMHQEWGEDVIFHEGIHPIINIVRNSDKKTYDALVAAVEKEAETNQAVAAILLEARQKYKEKGKGVQNDEALVEVLAKISTGKLRLNDVNLTLKQKLISFINKISKILGFGEVLETTPNLKLRKISGQISDVLNTGKGIEKIVGAENINRYKNTLTTFRDQSNNSLTLGDVQFTLYNNLSDPAYGVEYRYFRDYNDFKSLIDQGVVTDSKYLSDFNGVFSIVHLPDAAYSGEISKTYYTRENGKKVQKKSVISEGSGGIFFPAKFFKEKLMWASTKDAVSTFKNILAENIKLNNGKIYFALATAPYTKIISSTSFVNSTLNLFSSKAADQGYNIKQTQLFSLLKNAALNKVITKVEDEKTGEIIEKEVSLGFSKNDFKGKSYDEVIELIKDRARPENSSFNDRREFVKAYAKELVNYSKTNADFEKQLGEFLHIGIRNEGYKQMGKVEKGGYKLSQANVVNALAHMFTEPMLGQRTKEEIPSNLVYAMIEVEAKDIDNAFDIVESDAHPSYPFAVKLAETSNLKLHILQDRVNYKDSFQDNVSDQMISELPTSEQQRRVPTQAGISMSSHRINMPQMSEFNRTDFTEEKTLQDAGITPEQKRAWRDQRTGKRQERVPQVQNAAIALNEGNITFDEYVDVVRTYMPIKKIEQVPQIATFKEVVAALDANKLRNKGIVGLNMKLADGALVDSRLDIPAYNNYDTWVVALHKYNGGPSIGYGQTAVLTDVKFVSGATNAKRGIQIATKEKDKFPYATMSGRWKNEDPKAVYERANKLMDDPQWTQVGMNPFRHSFFYNKETGEPVIQADEVVQVGSLVLAKNVKLAPFGTEEFNNHFSFTSERSGETIQFSHMNRNEKNIRKFFDEMVERNVDEDIIIDAAKELYGLSEKESRSWMSDSKNMNSYNRPGSKDFLKDKKEGVGGEIGEMPAESNTVTERYQKDYQKEKKEKLEKQKNKDKSLKAKWNKVVVGSYDSKFNIRKFLEKASDSFSVSAARLRNMNGLIASSSQEAQEALSSIYEGMSERHINTFDELLFAMRVIDIDNRTERKYQAELANQEALNIQRINTAINELENDMSIGKEERVFASPEQIQNITKRIENKYDPAKIAREIHPIRNHGSITLNGVKQKYTSVTAKEFLDQQRNTMSKALYDEMMYRASIFKSVGQSNIDKLLQSGIISKEIAEDYRDDFYLLRQTLERLLDESDVTYLTNIVGISPQGFKALAKEGTEKTLERDSRLLLAESIFSVNRAVSKNNLRNSILGDFIITPDNFFSDPTANQSLKVDKRGADVSNMIRPAKYNRNSNGAVASSRGMYLVEDADKGFVNIAFKKDGFIQYFQLEENLAKQLDYKPTYDEAFAVVKWYNNITDGLNSTLTAFATRRNPVFFLGNMSMDIGQQVYFTDIWTQGSFVKSNIYSAKIRALMRALYYTDAFHLTKIGIGEERKQKIQDTIQEAMDAGLIMDLLSESTEQRKRSLDVNYAEEKEVGTGKFLWKKVDKALEAVSYLNSKTELGLRLAAYDQAKENITNQFMKENMLDNASDISQEDQLRIQEIAAAKARAYTDFAQSGTFVPKLNIAYLNSSIQAFGSATEYVADNPADAFNKTAQAFIGKTVGTFLTMLALGDAYDDLDEYDKDTYSILFTNDIGKKDEKGNPIYGIVHFKNNPSAIPVYGLGRRFGEFLYNYYNGKPVDPMTIGGSIETMLDLVNQASPFKLPTEISLEGGGDFIKKNIGTHKFADIGLKMLWGYDAFRGQDIESRYKYTQTPFLKGMDDKNIFYGYKLLAQGIASTTGFDPDNQVSPAKMQSVVESIITSPRNNIFVGLIYSAATDIANAVIEAPTEGIRGRYTLGDKASLTDTMLKRMITMTDAEKAERQRLSKAYKEVAKVEAATVARNETINFDLRNMLEKDPDMFYSNLDVYIQENYAGDDIMTSKIYAKANRMYKKDFRESVVPDEYRREVDLLGEMKTAKDLAEMFKYMYGSDKNKASSAANYMTDTGYPYDLANEGYNIYIKSLK